ncbi:glutathione S-transferase [Cognatiyoonia koreensis]|uniref:Glutathione S-transferase n=1 Tax=Cognatiyoonia koreensis TaxID=364200 RepID=A0A1I0Q5P0_9RHOB|nr:glutathione S-transferase family protein [Cognatiyoonia koreensis]SEW22292.1 glutathione S-transferase [Cognatiyoonia koreensis]
MTSTLRLHYAPDNASLCVRLALEMVSVPYTTVLVDRAARAQKSASYTALNPNGLIPTLETSKGVIFETGAILLWVADQTPGTLFPKSDAQDRGVALTWLFWLSNTLHPTLRMLFYPEQYARDPIAIANMTRDRLQQFLTLVDGVWPDVGKTPVLQCYLAPMLRWSALYGGDTRWFRLSDYPALAAFAHEFEDHPAARKAARAEGLGPTPFSAPIAPNPPEGSAT